MTETMTNDMNIKVPLEQLWEAFKDLHHLMPRLLPGFIDNIGIVDGPIDGGVGSVRECKFSPEVPGISRSKELIEVVDDKQHIFAYRVLEGEVLQTFSSYKVRWEFSPSVITSTGTAVKWTADGVPLKKSETTATVGRLPVDNLYRDSALLLMKQLEGHLIVTGEYSQPSAKDRLRSDLLSN